MVMHDNKVRPPTPPENGDPADDVADRLDNLDTTADKEGAFDAIASQHQGRTEKIIAVKSAHLFGFPLLKTLNCTGLPTMFRTWVWLT